MAAPTELNGSVYEKLSVHDEKLSIHNETLKDHATEISLLKKSDEDLMRELKGMKSDFTNLENTIWKTAQSTQDHFSAQNAQQWKLIEALNNGNQDDRKRKHELNKTKLEKYSEIIIKVASAGGILYLFAELLFGS